MQTLSRIVLTAAVTFSLAIQASCAAFAAGVVSDAANRSNGEELRFNARTGGLDYVKKLVEERGVPVDDADGYGNTALMLAAEKGDTGIVEYLLSRGADSALKNSSGRTAMDLAQRARQDRTLELLARSKKQR